MEKQLSKHIDQISEALEQWIRPNNQTLKYAIEQTVDEHLFSFEDIKHQILVLKHSLQKTHIKRWAEQSGLTYNSLQNTRVLCLHAGNLPLVGIQDLLAVILTGATYVGKLSKKDPYLLNSLLTILERFGLVAKNNQSLNIEELPREKCSALLFAGSESSIPEIKNNLLSNCLIDEKTPLLIRTAHFSIAFIDNNARETMEDLAEAVFRYGGAGCRSVAVVVAPFSLDSQKCEFTDYVESFWLKSPQHQKPYPSLAYRHAFNKAVGVQQAWLEHFLIEEHLEKPSDKFILHWVKGDWNTLENIVSTYSNGLQSVYSTAGNISKQVGKFVVSPLSQAQAPQVWWKPDGIDTIHWLQENVACNDGM